MKISIGNLKKLIAEANKQLMSEDATGDLDQSAHEGEDSLDAQVDRYLAQYESEAKSSKKEGKDFRTTIKRLMSEAGDDEDAGDKESNDATPAPAEQPAKMSTDDIDIDSFTNGVTRLIQNFDSLLEVRNTLLRRAENFLIKSYDESVVKSFEDNLRENHGLEIGKSKQDVADEEFQAPGADRAGADSGSGGAGGV